MNGKLNLRQLAELLPADLFGAEIDDRVTLVKEIFGITCEKLADGHSASLPGLGVFELTGDAANPIRFVPDKLFADTVNSPFSSFSPTVLTPEVSESDLEALEDHAVVVDAEPDTQQASVDPEVEEPTELHVPVATDILKPSADDNSEKEESVEKNDAVSPEAGSQETEVETVTLENTVPGEELPDPTVSKPVIGIDEIMSQAYTDQSEIDNEEPASEEETADKDDSEESASESGSRFGVGYFWGLLTGLVVGALLFLGYVVITSGMISSSAEGSLFESDIAQPALVEGIE